MGDWALRWTEGNEALQIAFVMFIFPVLMNAAQYYIIDSFIKDKDGGQGYEQVESEEDDSHEDGHEGSDGSVTEVEEEITKDGVKAHLKEANPTPVPTYDPHTDGEGSGVVSPESASVAKESGGIAGKTK